MSKIQSLPALKKTVLKLKKQGKRIVFANGCFDLLHPGHLKTLTRASRCGDILIVGLNSDASVRKIKGPGRPIMRQQARAAVLAALEAVDYVVLFKEKTPYKLIRAIRPHILVKGGDWAKNQIIGSEFVQKVVRIKVAGGHSTTKLIKKVKKSG